MRKITRRAFGVAGIAVALSATAGLAQQPKKVLVNPQTVIVRYVPGDQNELKPGMHIIIGAATKNADGSFGAAALNYGRDGIVPPM